MTSPLVPWLWIGTATSHDILLMDKSKASCISKGKRALTNSVTCPIINGQQKLPTALFQKIIWLQNLQKIRYISIVGSFLLLYIKNVRSLEHLGSIWSLQKINKILQGIYVLFYKRKVMCANQDPLLISLSCWCPRLLKAFMAILQFLSLSLSLSLSASSHLIIVFLVGLVDCGRNRQT